ncbi:MAG TPA: ABC transporter permease subunit [Candidatus Paceibacterota bacterium]|nr:ABC transporter permease subunit [Candidatus Paceibacterota bacterium]
MARMHYYSHRGRHQHPTTLWHRIFSAFLVPFFILVVAALIAGGAAAAPNYAIESGTLVAALGASIIRLLVAYVLSLVIGVPLGFIAEGNKRLEAFLLPVYDVLESIPVLAFFPVVILFFVRSGSLEGAALFILVFSMVWNIAFSTIGGLKVIPRDVINAGKVFGLSRLERLFQIELPALFPILVTGSILALADGWNIVIVAEALHAYAPQSANAGDLFGIGSILITAAGSGDNGTLIYALLVLIAAIALINVFLWQPLLARAERYKFE